MFLQNKRGKGIKSPSDAPLISLALSESTVDDGDVIVATITRSGGNLAYPSTVRLVTTNITADSDNYTPINEVITFGAGVASVTRDITISAGTEHPTLTFYVAIANVDPAYGRLDTATNRNEVMINASVVLTPVTITGITTTDIVAGNNLVITVTLSQAVPVGESRTYAFTETTDIAPANIGARTFNNGVTNSPKKPSGTTFAVNVPAGVSTFTITYPISADVTTTPYASFTLTSGLATTGKVYPVATTVTSVSSQSVTEGGTLVYGVVLSGLTAVSTTYSFALSGNATSAVDFTASPTFTNGVTLGSNQITVPAGVSSFAVNFATINDALEEASETLILTIGGQSGTGTILDNDSAIPANAVELWGNDNVTTKYASNSQGIINMFHGLAFNDRTYLSPISRVPTNIPNGVTVNGIIFTDKPENGYIRPGTYTITADKPVVLNVFGSGAGYTSMSGGTATGTFTVLPSGSGIYNASTGYGNLTVGITGQSGVTGDVWLDIVHNDDAAYKARGFISTPRWIEQNSHLSGLRYMDLLQTNSQLIQYPSQNIPERSTSWDNNNGIDFARYTPLTMLAKREIELFHVTGKLRKVHLNLPTGNFILNVDAVDPATNRLTTIYGTSPASMAQHITDGQQVIVRPYGTLPAGVTEGIYYLKFDGTNLTLSATQGGADVDITSTGSMLLFSNHDPAALHLSWMTELYNVTHTIDGTTYNFRDVVSKIIIEVGNEPWNGGGAFKTYYICLNTGSYRETGVVGDFLQGLKYFSLKGWKAAQLAGWPDAKIERAINCQVGWPDHVLPLLNLVDTNGILSSGTAIKNIPNIAVAIAPYYNIGNPATQAEYNKITWAADGALTQTDAQWRDLWLYGIQLSGIGTGTFCAAARAIKADIRIISYEGGSHDDFFFSGEEWAGKNALGKRINQFLHTSAYAAQIHQAYYDSTYVANRVMSYNQYYSHGYYTTARVKMTSTTSTTIGLGSKTFAYSATISSANVGEQVEIRSDANGVNAMSGLITAITPNTSVTVDVSKVSGSGTFDDWIIGTTSMSPWGLTNHIHEADNAVMAWWKALVPYGIDSGVVSAVTTPADTAEGSTMVFPITTVAHTDIKRVEMSITSESVGDIGAITASNGATISGRILTIPANVTSFNINVAITNDTTQEYNEPVTLTVDGISATGLILYNDGATTPYPDFADIVDLQISGSGGVPVTQGANRQEMTFTYDALGEQVHVFLHLAQPNKAGTPMVLPDVPVGGIVHIELLLRVDAAGFAPNFQLFKVDANGWLNPVFFTPISTSTVANVSASTYGTVKSVYRWQNNTGSTVTTAQQLGMYIRHNSAVLINAAMKDFVAYVE